MRRLGGLWGRLEARVAVLDLKMRCLINLQGFSSFSVTPPPMRCDGLGGSSGGLGVSYGRVSVILGCSGWFRGWFCVVSEAVVGVF